MNSAYWKNKTVVVSGGAGFIGSHFTEELAIAGAKVISLCRSLDINNQASLPDHKNIRYIQVDLLDRKELESICKYSAREIDCFVHCAAMDGNTEFKLKYAADIFDVNNQLVSNVLNVCRTADINNVVLLSSAEVYSTKASGKILETDDYHNHMTYQENGYVLSKIFAEIAAELHHKQYGAQVYIPRPTNVYGPRDSFKTETNRVIPSMIRKVARGETIEIWGDGRQTRSFIFVKDLVYATLKMVEDKATGPMNIATKDQVSILDLATYVSTEYGAKNSVVLDRTKPVGARARVLDVDRMYKMISFEPSSIKKGLSITVDWYRSIS